MTKRLAATFLLVLTAFLFASCNPDAQMENQLHGSWRRVSGDYTYTMTFGSDGWWSMKVTESGVQVSNVSAKWKVDGSRIVLTNGSAVEYDDFSLSGSTLIFNSQTYTKV